MLRTLAVNILSGGALTFASVAVAQPPAPAQQLGGAPVPGVCLLAQATVYGASKIGVAASARLNQLAQQAQADVDAARQPIETDAKKLESQRSSMKAADFQQSEAALNTRLQALQQRGQLYGREIEATRRKALQQIAVQAQPVIADAYRVKHCGLLIDRQSVIGGNMANDLTADVIRNLDMRISTMNFDLEKLPAGQ